MPDVQAALDRIERDNRNDLALLRESTVPSIGRAMLQLRRDLLQVANNTRDPRLSSQAVIDDTMREVAAARAKAQKALDSADTGAKQAIANIRDDLKSKLEPKRTPEEQLVDELQRAAAARRLDILKARVETGEIIKRAAGSGDRAMLAVLREDLPLMASPNDQQAQNRLESLQAQLDQAEAPLMSAMQLAARKIQSELATGQAALTTSFALARGEATGASRTFGGNAAGPVSIIADWSGGGYRVEFKTPDGGLNAPPTPTPSGTTGVQQPTSPQPTAAQAAADYMRNQNRR
jgi:hypothetical protein